MEYGVGGNRQNIAAAQREIEALGFARIKHGRGGNREYRTPNLFRLTYKHGHDTSPPTNEWKRFTLLAEAQYVSNVARNNIKPKRVTVSKLVTRADHQSDDLNSRHPGHQNGDCGRRTKKVTTSTISGDRSLRAVASPSRPKAATKRSDKGKGVRGGKP